LNKEEYRKRFNKSTNSMSKDGMSLNKEFNEDNFPSIQIINKRVDPSKLSNGYYQRLRYEIKKRIKQDTEILFINFIPKKDINEKWELETLLHLQKEFTNFIIIPPSSIDSSELKEWNDVFNPIVLMNNNH
jgi:hypothetical protein